MRRASVWSIACYVIQGAAVPLRDAKREKASGDLAWALLQSRNYSGTDRDGALIFFPLPADCYSRLTAGIRYVSKNRPRCLAIAGM